MRRSAGLPSDAATVDLFPDRLISSPAPQAWEAKLRAITRQNDLNAGGSYWANMFGEESVRGATKSGVPETSNDYRGTGTIEFVLFFSMREYTNLRSSVFSTHRIESEVGKSVAYLESAWQPRRIPEGNNFRLRSFVTAPA